jgi:flagellar assembly protein FliH
LNPESGLLILRDAVAALPGLSQHTVLHANPEDAALLQPLLTKDPAFTQLTWTVAEDPRMERGGCRLETAQSEVDATLATRWSRVVAALGREDSWRIESKIS